MTLLKQARLPPSGATTDTTSGKIGAETLHIFVNGEPRDVATATPLLSVLDVPPGASVQRGIAVAIDGTVVPRAQLKQTLLHEGARVEIVTAVQGG